MTGTAATRPADRATSTASAQAAEPALETPSGKGVGDENFPVGSWLLPARLRPHVAVFYAFARAADDIADNGALDGAEKVRRLDAFEAALTGTEPSADTSEEALAKPRAVARSLAETGVSRRHCVDLLAAFKQDARKHRYDDWADLMGYCELSANPVGRYLLDLHGERSDGYPASDGLCSALQVLNHLQDIKHDFRTLDRVYLPADWMRAAGVTPDDLAGDRCSPGLRRVIDQCLDGIDRLLSDAEALPLVLDDWRLAMESAAIVRLARRLAAMLRAGDPLAERIAASRTELAVQALIGAAAIAVRRLAVSRARRRALAAASGAGK